MSEKFVLIGAKLYAVSNYGRVMNLKTGNIITPDTSYHGYARITVRNSIGKIVHYYIHRLVASLFIPRPPKCTEIHHIDGNKLNNNVDNLLWMIPKDHHKTHRIIRRKANENKQLF